MIDALGKSDNLTGPVVGSIPGSIRAIVNPTAQNTLEQVEEVVQRNLRVILGPQFTAEEGTRLIARAYNPSLDEKTNITRLKRLSESMKKAALAKRDASRYFEEKGTLQGYKGSALVTMRGLEEDAFGGSGQPTQPSGGPATPSNGGWSAKRKE